MKRIEYKYIVGIVFVFGLFMDLLDMTITNVALPTLARDFGSSTTTIEWVVTGYLLSLAVFIPVSGWAGDRFGTKRVFMFALSVFVAGSLLSGLAWNMEALIGFRVLQGIGGGMLTPVGTAMLFRAFPPAERAAASALLAIPAVVAPATGPVLGGYLVEYQTWRWIFFVNIPIGLAGLLVAWIFLKEDVQERAGRLDVPGFLLSAAGLASLVYALSEAGSRTFSDARVVVFGLAGLAIIAAFAVVELRTKEPMIDLRLFRDRLFTAANTVQLVAQGGLQGALFLLPLFLQFEQGLSPLQSGLTTFPQAIGVVMMVQPAGRLYRRVGPRRMMMLGMAGTTVTTLAFFWVGVATDQWTIRAIMLARGWSFAFSLIPLQTATFATIRNEDTGRASAVFNSGRQVAASFGVALLGTVLTTRLTAHNAQLGNPLAVAGATSAFQEAFLAAAIVAALGVVASLLIDDKAAAATMAPARAVSGTASEAPEERLPVGAH
ncbi:MAG: DHA2 family efflux MFS transporter permease subunit [Dehalococcoidia bacterium]|nr:DHA2 family efflux MFS transporter permease subunit [Dehalococcoidia bacterium]